MTFAQPEKKAPVVSETAAAAKKTKVVFSDAQRAQNTGIVLKKMNIPAIELSDALVTYNEEVLVQPILELLVPIMPTEAEFKTVQTGIEGLPEGEMDDDDYDPCDLFIYLVGVIVGNTERVKSMLFKNAYRKQCVELLKLIDYFTRCYDFIKTNEHFKKFLSILLAIGKFR